MFFSSEFVKISNVIRVLIVSQQNFDCLTNSSVTEYLTVHIKKGADSGTGP